MALLLAAALVAKPVQGQRHARSQAYRMAVQGQRRQMTPPAAVQQRSPPEAAHPAAAQGAQQTHSAPIERQAPAQIERQAAPTPPPNAVVRNNPRPGNAAQFKGDHIADWVTKHNNLSPEQQQQALEHEPGFHELPPVVQQHLRDRLAQLNAMPPQKKQQALNNIERMEAMSVPQRQQFRDAMSQWSSLPPDQKRAVKRSFLQIRQLPPDQRNAAMASGRFTTGFNDAQRASLNNLIRVEPWMPADIGGGR